VRAAALADYEKHRAFTLLPARKGLSVSVTTYQAAVTWRPEAHTMLAMSAQMAPD